MAAQWQGSREPNTAPASSLGDAISEFLQTSGMSVIVKHPEIHAAWQRVVGEEFACHTRLWAFRRNALEIAADSSALMTDLEFHRKTLLEELRREVRKPFIHTLRFVLKRFREADGEE